MPLPITAGAPTLVIRRHAYEESNLARVDIDAKLGLTDEEFRVEGDMVAIGPIYDAEAFESLVEDLEAAGLSYYDDFFELSGNWPGWLSVLAATSPATGRNPSRPQG